MFYDKNDIQKKHIYGEDGVYEVWNVKNIKEVKAKKRTQTTQGK